jgi:hypothetical protein
MRLIQFTEMRVCVGLGVNFSSPATDSVSDPVKMSAHKLILITIIDETRARSAIARQALA